MTSKETLANTDRSSRARIGMTGFYFWHSIKMKVIVLANIAFLSIVLASILGIDKGDIFGSSLLSIPSFIILFSPLLFTVRASDEVFCSLPALGWEKRAFVMLFSFILFPLLITVPGSIYLVIVMPEHTAAEVWLTGIGVDIATRSGAWFIIGTFLSTYTAIAAGLWAAFASRRNRALRTTLAVIGTIMLDGFIGFVIGFMHAMQDKQINNIAQPVADSMNQFGPVYVGLWALLFLFATWKASRAISHKQV